MMRRILCGSAVVLAGMAVAGCSGHGKYTSEHRERSKEKAAGMKAANEFEQARQAFMVGELEKALRAIDRSITIHPGVARSHVLRGRILIERSDLDGAMESLLAAEAVEPENVDAQYYMGIVHERAAQSDEAMDRFMRAAELAPSNPQYAIACAEAMVDLGMLSEAEEFLTSRSSQFQHNAGVRQSLGHLAMLRGDHQRAADLFHEAMLLAPDDWGVLEDLVQAQIVIGRFADAEYNLSRLLAVPENSDRRDLKLLQARCMNKTGRPTEARELLVGLTSETAGQRDVEAWIELGNVCFVLRDMNRVRQASTRIIALAPQRPEGYMLRGLMQRRNGDFAGALDSAEKAAERRGDSVEPLMFKGLVLKDLGRTAESQACFAQVAKENPSAMPKGAVVGVPSDRE